MSSRNHGLNSTYIVGNSMSNKRNKCSKILHFVWKTITCLFSHITLVSLVVSYCILGAFTFESLEADNEKEVKKSIKKIRANVTEQLWTLTSKSLVLRQENWTLEAIKELRNFEKCLLKAITEDGWDGNEDPESVQWTFSGALFFSIIVITTIGYGHIAPKTHWGKVVTIFYAILGIPMMLLCLSNIGDMMATSFKFIYWRICCYVCTKKPKKRRLKNNKKLRKSIKRSMRISQKSTDSGYPTTALTPSFSDTEFNHKRLSPMKHLIRGGSLDRRNNQSKVLTIEQIKRTPIFCNKYVANDLEDFYTYTRRQSTPIVRYTDNSKLKKADLNKKTYLMPPLPTPSPSVNLNMHNYSMNEDSFPVEDKSESPRRKKRTNSSYVMSSPRIMSPMGFAVQRRQPRYETDSDSQNDLGSSEISAMIQNSRVQTKVKPVPIWLCVFLVISYIIGGAFLFKAWENWKFLDSAYFCFITLTTIGFGDFVPAKRVQQNAEVSIALCSLYLLFGISLLAMSFNLVQEEVIANVKSVARRLGIIKSVHDNESSESSSDKNDDSDVY